MALLLEKTDESGNLISYWRIAPYMHVDFVEKFIRATLLGYKDQTAREAGKVPNMNVHSPSMNMPFSIDLSGDAAIDALKTGDARAALYEVAKLMSEFDGYQNI